MGGNPGRRQRHRHERERAQTHLRAVFHHQGNRSGHRAWAVGLVFHHHQQPQGADGSAIGTGNQNTIDIIAGCSDDGIAAKLCSDLSITGDDGTVYNDWYLPSKNELIKLFENRTAIGGFDMNASYWSSTEGVNPVIDAWIFTFAHGYGADVMKDTLDILQVRAIRSF